MTCHDLERQRDAYLAGTLAEADALALEVHAANCDACGALLEQATRLPSIAFAPPLPPELKLQTMAAVRSKSSSRARPRWWGGVVALAAAAALVFMVTRPNPKFGQRPAADTTVALAGALDTTTVEGLVDARARPEFSALDAAAQELQDALNASPNDAELRSFLASVKARRDELSRRVKDARS